MVAMILSQEKITPNNIVKVVELAYGFYIKALPLIKT